MFCECNEKHCVPKRLPEINTDERQREKKIMNHKKTQPICHLS